MRADESARREGGWRGANPRGRHPASLLAACLVLAALVTLSACGRTSTSTGSGTVPGTPGAHTKSTATAGITPSPTVSSAARPANSPFVCANPAGSSLTYAFVNADAQVYAVTGCSTPVQLSHFQRTDVLSLPIPRAWSPSRRYLAVLPNLQQDYCLKIFDTSTGAVLATKYECFSGDPSQSGDQRTFVGWIDDDTFLGRIDLDSSTEPLPVRLVRVNIHTQAETPVKSYAWMADPKLRGQSLFFAGRVNASDTNAYLYRLSLADGSETRLVPLGLSGFGGCQVGNGPCSWTAPWDVSPDGTHILYHNPGADSLPSDTHGVPDTPVYYAHVDGSAAVQVLAGLGSQGLLSPAFDPTGTRVTAQVGNASLNSSDIVYQPVAGGAIERVTNVTYWFWRGDGQAVVDVSIGYSGDLPLSTARLHVLASHSTQPLAANTFFYLWAN